MSRLLSIDPGVQGSGVALWEKGQLARAAYCKRLPDYTPIVDTALAIVTWLNDFVMDAIVCEIPQTYGGRAARGDTNDLIRVAMISGAIAHVFSDLRGISTDFVYPHEWKGSAKKEVTKARLQQDLTPAELKQIQLPAKSLAHNVWDAIGIGLYYLKREKLR